ncbi:hypothetical protein [Streptomyces sp. NBC_01462]|uniref:hypothetical protein n=1 Tax=Streptomyces sp. NBC_01462 TaxID=2903876 RepID=UPI002E349C55|nr:hypothetical protein [Streptomyces sp. NBC_01462]
MRTPSPHDDPQLPLRRKPRLKLVVIGVVVVGAASVLPPDHVSAVAEVVGAAASTMVLLGKREEGPTLG